MSHTRLCEISRELGIYAATLWQSRSHSALNGPAEYLVLYMGDEGGSVRPHSKSAEDIMAASPAQQRMVDAVEKLLVGDRAECAFT